MFRAIKDLPERDKIKEAMKLRKDKSMVDIRVILFPVELYCC